MANCKDCIHYEPCLEYGNILDPIHGGIKCDSFKSAANVAPRAEVAREICCKIEEEIVAALESNYKAKAERMANPRIDADEFISYCEGKIAALRGIEDFVEELKKKYTEGKYENQN